MIFSFMDINFSIKNIFMLILYWFIFILGIRFFFLNYTWSPTLLILPMWIFFMLIVLYNAYKIRTYLQIKYNGGEYLFTIKELKLQKNYKEDEIVIRYTKNIKKFMLLGLGTMIIIAFTTMLTTINWNYK